MKISIKKQPVYLVILAAVTLFVMYMASNPIATYDTFFGLKIADQVFKSGHVPDKEIFSWSAYGRTWIAYEWMAQVIVYFFNSIGGLRAVSLYVAGMLGLFFILVYALLRFIFRRDFTSSLVLAFFLTANMYEFFVARPQIIGYTCMIATIFLIYAYILQKKNWLWISFPITYLWTNSHGSFIFIPFFFGSFAVVAYLYQKIQKDPDALHTFKTLALFGIVNFCITLAPPLWYKPYLLLYQFATDMKFMSQFVSEWQPLSSDTTYQFLYYLSAGLFIMFLLVFGIRTFKNKNYKNISRLLLISPLACILLASFQAVRHVPLGIIVTLLSLSYFLPHFRLKTYKAVVAGVCSILIIVTSVWLMQIKKASIEDTAKIFPVKMISFLKQNHLNGRMFNEFGVGGYLIYYLYPDYQVFFDGRADIYHCCEMRDYWPLITSKYHHALFKEKMYSFIHKYDFSYVIAPPNLQNPLNFTSSNLMANTLLDDPEWSLIYFSDHMQILVKKDGLNDTLIRKYAKTDVTPYRLSSFRAGKQQQALKEYEQMISIADSSIAETGLGEVYLSLGEYDKAKKVLEKALTFPLIKGRPYIGLGKVALYEGNNEAAIEYFEKGLDLSPDNGEGYLLLGQTMIKIGQNDEGIEVLNEGLRQQIDFLSRQKIVQTLNQIAK